jgi:hypothetical protein
MCCLSPGRLAGIPHSQCPVEPRPQDEGSEGHTCFFYEKVTETTFGEANMGRDFRQSQRLVQPPLYLLNGALDPEVDLRRRSLTAGYAGQCIPSDLDELFFGCTCEVSFAQRRGQGVRFRERQGGGSP